MSINTKNITSAKAGVPKTLQPGNVVAKIINISLEEFTILKGAYNVVLNLEGTDMGADFEGFFINKDQPNLGRHKGQVGRVKAGEYAFADGTTKSGIIVKRDDEILKFINNICKELGLTWLDDADGKYDTIEALVKAFGNEKPYKDMFINFCLGGKEYQNKEGYTNFDLFLPKYAKGRVAFEKLDKPGSKLMEFNEADHIRKAKVKDVASFGDASTTTSSDFEL